MMQLKEIMTTEEQEAVEQLINAHLNEQDARLNLTEAQADLRQAGKELTRLYFCDEHTDTGPQRAGRIPHRFVAYFQDEPYLIEADEEGDGSHKISRIYGVLDNRPDESGSLNPGGVLF